MNFEQVTRLTELIAAFTTIIGVIFAVFIYLYQSNFRFRKLFTCFKSPWIEHEIPHTGNVDSKSPSGVNKLTIEYYKSLGYTFFTREYEHNLEHKEEYQIVWYKNFQTGIKKKYINQERGVIVCRKEKTSS